jgi:threonine dehydrogenase-like Zn-dependent dehydrogenase
MSEMRAVRIGGRRGPARVETVEKPTVSEGHALLRMKRVGLCEEDLRVATEARGETPFTMGREGIGLVDEVGPGGDPSLKGARVTFEPAKPCGVCELCKRGLSAHCPERRLLGEQGSEDGCLAEFVVVPIRSIVRLPDSMDDERALQARLFGKAHHASLRVRLEGRPYITILGDSRKALAMGQVMSRLNAQVRVIGWDEGRLSMCEKWGVRHRHADEPGLHADQDVVIDCRGSVEAVELAMAMIRPRGSVLATMPGGLSLHAGAVVGKELDILGTSGGGVAEGLALLEDDSYVTSGLVTKRATLDEAVKAL